MPLEGWHYVAGAFREDTTVILWLDGGRKVDGQVRHPLAPSSQWLRAGNTVKGDAQLAGALRDLCAFDRVLDDAEVRQLHAAGLPERPARNTAARLAATARTNLHTWSTNVLPATDQVLVHRRYTTEDGLAGNIVQAVLQAANGYLWVGTEDGLSRFDGRKFEIFNDANTPAFKVISHDVMCLAEAADGAIWIGTYGGLARFRSGEFTAFTNGLPERFVLQAEPAANGSRWVAGFRLDPEDRGPCRLRRFQPTNGTSDLETIVPGHVRRLVPVTNGIWIASEKPEALFFWDGKAPNPVVVGLAANSPATLSLGGAALPPGAELRGWVNSRNERERWAEIKLRPEGPVFH